MRPTREPLIVEVPTVLTRINAMLRSWRCVKCNRIANDTRERPGRCPFCGGKLVR